MGDQDEQLKHQLRCGLHEGVEESEHTDVAPLLVVSLIVQQVVAAASLQPGLKDHVVSKIFTSTPLESLRPDLTNLCNVPRRHPCKNFVEPLNVSSILFHLAENIWTMMLGTRTRIIVTMLKVTSPSSQNVTARMISTKK